MIRMSAIPLLTAAVAVIGANSLILPPIASVIADDFGTTPATIIRAMGAYGLGTVLAALFLAPRADTIGADRSLHQATAVLVLSLLVSTFAPNAGILLLSHALSGIGAGMALPAIYGLASQVAPNGKEKQTVSLVLSGWTVSIIAGVLMAGAVADLIGWRAVYGILTALTAGVWVLLRGNDMGVHTQGGSPTSPLTALRVPGIWRGLFSGLMLMSAFFGAYSFMGTHVMTHLDLSATASGAVSVAYGVGYGLGAVLNRFIVPLSLRGAAMLAFTGLTLSYIAMMLSVNSYVLLLLFALPWGIFQHFGLNAVVMRLTALDSQQTGAIMGLNSATTYLAVTGGAIAFRYPYDAGGVSYCIAVAAVCAALAFVELSLKPAQTKLQI